MTEKKLTLSQLEQYLYKAAWILKGPVDASDFKVYIFPLLFCKYLFDVYDEEYISLPEFHRFEIPLGFHWNCNYGLLQFMLQAN